MSLPHFSRSRCISMGKGLGGLWPCFASPTDKTHRTEILSCPCLHTLLPVLPSSSRLSLESRNREEVSSVLLSARWLKQGLSTDQSSSDVRKGGSDGSSHQLSIEQVPKGPERRRRERWRKGRGSGGRLVCPNVASGCSASNRASATWLRPPFLYNKKTSGWKQ